KHAGPLQISENNRYLTDANGKPFFWLGDTGWLLFSKLTKEEAETYLVDRRNKGFNVIQVMLLHTLKATNVYGDSALHNSDVSTPNVQGRAISEGWGYWELVDHVVDF